MPHFSVDYTLNTGRLGKISFEGLAQDISTPFLFPVASFVTGTTARGGGIWKYILQADPHGNSLMRLNTGILSQVLHFLDYGVSSNGVKKWREASLRRQYEVDTHCDYTGAIFLDSGGFKLMWRDGINLDKYGIDLSPKNEAISITRLQLDFGANIIASLDYPLPPGLAPSEAKHRMKRSRKNAIEVARYLRLLPEASRPFFYMPVHGLTPSDMSNYVKNLFQTLNRWDLSNEPSGIAVGSLVPLRSSNQNLYTIIQLIQAAKQAIPSKLRSSIPVHIFGITGLLLPFLAYLDVDTFDSSTYVKEAINLGYLDPQTRQSRSVLELEEITCNCPVCATINLREMQESLVVDTKSRPLPNGHYKSRYFSEIALHNLWQDWEIVQNTRDRIQDNSLDEYLIEIASRFPRMRYALEALAEKAPQLKQRMTKTVQVAKKIVSIEAVAQYNTLSRKPSDFDITANGYRPPEVAGTHILLIIPCSAEKPYSASNTHQYVFKHLTDKFGIRYASIHKVTLSGLYGPVPEDQEADPAVLEYNFRLTSENHEQSELCIKRLVTYLQKHHNRYSHFVAYGTSKAYRTVFERASQEFPELVILPQNLKARKLTEFFRLDNIAQLVQYIETVFSSDDNTISEDQKCQHRIGSS